ncbi:bifunctional adenosylcobinamide kinase/adenosylcobinamide-phosphate guanylyltransferase [Bermanella marisrubri]|uniref:Bifunctional adenosylcobalamin biosynthesis protein n=1 Tax=Bermanella marisrubri TaxID=207949 RepID=Q1MZQ8_9GAMM|nr:bifunctional adenosylcobinamide kinase/adenosylcobinamide-phosphate guanylyltransferase [Bermanella marisrubri]EAT11499.1 adenosylcobinamide kinase [Oceanobacter sp. RED65] [Bermanella marisrubri]QIZ85074.1 bifunctional adenosylcobinamide kinase/adenosylcobinamide-phosphate guanylyltransferase [Bermanella marisrubri]
MREIHLVLGGARSGKSAYSEQLALGSKDTLHYIATAQAFDDEMQTRIQRHQADRSARFHTLEEPIELSRRISELSVPGHTIVVDCLTLWMSNLLMCEPENMATRSQTLIDALKSSKGRVILVSNEISMGVIPLGESNRRFVDELGRLHQGIAREAQHVTLMVAGIPSVIK